MHQKDSRAFVIIDPLLPCRIDPGGEGFVYALAADAIKFAYLATHENLIPQQISINVNTATAFTLRLASIAELTSNQSQKQFVGTIDDEMGRIWLRDLLGKIRKDQHISICANEDVEASDKRTGFEDMHFLPRALPELDWRDLDTSRTFLKRRFAAPILITGMTGGIERGAEINRRLALAAQQHQIPMGIGSQRIALERAELAEIFDVKRHAPNVFLIANIGAAQMVDDLTVDDCQRAIDMIGADALAIHLNVLQETVQVEGDRRFKGLLQKLKDIRAKIRVPLIIKEVGSGVDPITAHRLEEIGVDAIDIGGRGGTSWSFIEGKRSNSELTVHAAATFRDWGIPTAYALAALRRSQIITPLIATGGIRSGLDVAKATAMGATMAGIGLPLFRAALAEDPNAVSRVLATYIHELKTTLLVTGSATLADLKTKIHAGLPLVEAAREMINRE